jgi:hypothetical protein
MSKVKQCSNNNDNSILYYLCAESTATRPLQTQHSVGTRAQGRYNNTIQYNNNNNTIKKNNGLN